MWKFYDVFYLLLIDSEFGVVVDKVKFRDCEY